MTRSHESFRPAWVTIDLDALGRNLDRLKKVCGRARIAAVVKADAYGHGAVPTVRALEQAGGVDLLAVAMPEEGAELRLAGIHTPVLVLGAHLPSQIPLLLDFDLMPTISTQTQLSAWCGVSGDRVRPVHLKVDTGMRRLGFAVDALPDVLDRIRQAKGLELAGVLSHFADASDPEAELNVVQETDWQRVERLLADEERGRVVRHIANSAAALTRPSSRPERLDQLAMVRLGLALYGVDPIGSARSQTGYLEAVMSVRARIVAVRQVATGEGVGYHHRWRAGRPSRVGLLPLGYADGYGWRLGNRAQALAGDRRVDVIGNVSMDMTAIDLTDSEHREGSEVTLLGGSGRDSISAHDLARWAGTIPYETLVAFGLRLPRVHVQGGRTVAVCGRHSRILEADTAGAT